MPQISFLANANYIPSHSSSINYASLSFFPFNVYDSISLKTLNMALAVGAGTGAVVDVTLNMSMGLYSLNVNTLSLANSLSASQDPAVFAAGYFSMTNTSANQNISPGTWYWGFLFRSSQNLAGDNPTASLFCQSDSRLDPANAFLGSFIGGRMTVSTSVLPSSYATSDLDTTGADAMSVPYILLCS